MDSQAIAQFRAVTDTDERVAARALEAAGGKLELAISLFLESHEHQPALDHSEDDPELAAATQASLESAHSTLGDAASSAALGHSSPPVGWAEAGAAAEGSRCVAFAAAPAQPGWCTRKVPTEGIRRLEKTEPRDKKLHLENYTMAGNFDAVLDACSVELLMQAVDNVTLARCAMVCVEWWKVARMTMGYTLATLTGHKVSHKVFTVSAWPQGLHSVSVAFSPDGRSLASGSGDRTVKLWRLSDGAATATLSGHSHWVISVAFSPDGRNLASGSGDRTVKLWRLSDGAATATLSGHNDYVRSVAFSPDGRSLASGSDDKTVKLWRLSDGAATATLSGHSGYVFSVAFSPDGRSLASASSDNTVKLWRLSDGGAATATLSGHSNIVSSVAFSPDGRSLASGSDDNTVKLWQA